MNLAERTRAHNLAAIYAMDQRQHVAATTGATCPKCGEGVNPTILANLGHCLGCQTAEFIARARRA